MKTNKKSRKKAALSYGMNDYFASCLVIISFIAALFNFIGLQSEDYVTVVLFDTIYGAVATGMILLLTGRVKSESFKRAMVLVSTLCAVALIYIVVGVVLFAAQ